MANVLQYPGITDETAARPSAFIGWSLVVYVVLMPFTDISIGIPALGLTHFAALLLALFVLLFCFRSDISFVLKTEDALFILMLVAFTVSLVASLANGTYGPKSINHHLAKLYVWTVLFYGTRIALQAINYDDAWLRRLQLAIIISVLAAALVCGYEFIERNSMDGASPTVDDLIPRQNADIERYDARFIEVFRTRGFVEESGHLGFFFEAFGPLAALFLWRRWRKAFALAVIAVIVIGYLSTFTTTGALLLLPTLLAVALHLRNKALLHVCFVFAGLVVVAWATAELLNIPVWEYLNDKLGDNTLSGRSSNVEQLWERILDFNLFQVFFGVGPGATYTLDMSAGAVGILSLYGVFFAEGGLIALSIFMVLVMRVMTQIRQIPDQKLQFALSFSLIWSLGHYLAIGNYWYPWLWFMMAFVISGTARKLAISNKSRP